MIWRLHFAWDGLLRPYLHALVVAQEGAACRGFATEGAEDGRPSRIAASRGGGAEAIVACLGRILA